MRNEEDQFSVRDKKKDREKRNKHRTDEVKLEIARQATEAGKRNARLEKERNSNEKVQENVQVRVILKRMLDKGVFEEYLRWLKENMEVVSMGENPDIDMDKYIRIERARSSGSGGQNVNTRDTSISAHHDLLRLHIIKVNRERTKEQNENKARSRMANLIKGHVDNWLEELKDKTDLSWEEYWKKQILRIYDEMVVDKKIQGDKRSEIESICNRIFKIETPQNNAGFGS